MTAHLAAHAHAAAHAHRWRAVIDHRIEEHLASQAGPGGILRQPLRHLVRAGGRRFRPLLTLATCELAGGDPRDALDTACALELIHTASLILDDLPCMDDATTRRGVEALHIRYGTASAILVAFALFNQAHQLLAGERSRGGAERQRTIAEAIGASGMIGGQEADLRLSSGALAPSPELRELRLRKTSALIEAAAVAGAHAGGASGRQLVLVEEFGRRLGAVFQRVDDNLDASDDRAVAGPDVTPPAALLAELEVALGALRSAFSPSTARRTVEELALTVIAT